MLRFDFELLWKWFQENCMTPNVDKCHFMCLGKCMENDTPSLINSSLITAIKRKYLGLLLTIS